MSHVIGRPAAKGFAAAIVLMGVIRFALTSAGLPDSTVKYFSMTAIIIAGIFYFALTTDTHKDRLKASYVLLIPYMVVEVSVLGYAWASGHPTIFHAKEYNLGTSLPAHTIGHFVGGLTWEPISAFLVMEFIWLVGQGVYRLMGRRQQTG
jgi:hypothetical protein